MRKMKRLLATLLAVVMVLSSLSLNAFADNVAGSESKDRSQNFEIVSLKLEVNKTEIYDSASGAESEAVELDSHENPSVAFYLSWKQTDSIQADFSAGDYLSFEICTVSGSTAACFSGINSSIDLYINIDGESICIGTGTLRSETTGEDVTLYYQVVFNEKIEGVNNVAGAAEGSATVNGLNTGDKVEFKVAEALLAEYEKTTNPNADKGSFANGSAATNKVPSKGSLGYNSTNGTVYWRISLSELVEKQFYDYQKGTTPEYEDLIVEDILDIHQTFTVDTTLDNSFGLFVEFRRAIYLYNSTANYDPTSVGYAENTPFPIWRVNNTGFSILDKMTEIIPEDYASAEVYVRSTSKSYTVLKEEDPENPGYTRERLIMNFGAPGNDGFKYWDFSTKESMITRLINLKAEFEPVKTYMDNSSAALDDNEKYSWYNASDKKVYTYTWAEWKNWLQGIADSIVYYSGDPYIYSFELDIKTQVKTDQSITGKVGSVKNSFAASGGFSKSSAPTMQANKWSANITATVANGDVLVYKVDSLYGSGNLQGAIEGVEFEVYKKGSDSQPLRFNLSEGKYKYSASGAYSVVTTDADGSIILSGLAAGSSYYLKEISAPEGYCFFEEEQTEFTVSSASYVTKWIYNDPMGMTFTKVDAESGSALEGATFKLYKTYGDEEVTGFAATDIQGTTYLVYDGSGTDMLTTGSDGKLTIVRLPAGEYYLVEVSAPEGYQLSVEEHSFTLPDAKSQDAIVDLGEIENEKQVDSNAAPPIPVKATFGGTKTLQGADIADYDGGFEFVLTQTGGPAVLANAETKVNDGSGFTFSELTFEKIGEYTFTVAENGGTEAGITYDNTLYTIVVTVILDGTTNGLQKSVVIRNVDKGVAVDDIAFENKYTEAEVPIAPPSGAINILKVNENEKALPGAEFAIYDAKATASNARPVATLKSGANGYDATGVTLDPGSYRLVETKAPIGYTGTDEIVYFIVNNKGLIDNIRYSKDDTATGSNASMASSSNAVYYDYDYYYFDADGNMQTVDSLEEWEEIKDTVDITLLEDDGLILRILFTIVNEWNGDDEPDKGFIKIAKYYDPNGNEVPDEAKNGRQTYSFYVRDKDGKLVTTAAVNVYWDAARNMFCGTTTVGNLVAGEKYYITEIHGFNAPFTFAWDSATEDKYVLEDGYLVVTAGKSAATAPMITGINTARPITPIDIVKEYTLAIRKTDAYGKTLNGITFTLMNSAGETVSVVTADGGKAVFSGLTEGTYTLKEVKYGSYKIMSDYTFTVGSASENCTVTEVDGTLYIQLTNKRATGASGFDTAVETDNVLWNVIVNTSGGGGGGTTPGTPTTPTNPEAPTTPATPDTPPVTPGNNLVPNNDGSYYEVDENGVALGRWYQDEDGKWIFDQIVPLAGLAKTGEQNAQWLMLLMLMSGLGGAALVYKRRKDEEA